MRGINHHRNTASVPNSRVEREIYVSLSRPFFLFLRFPTRWSGSSDGVPSLLFGDSGADRS